MKKQTLVATLVVSVVAIATPSPAYERPRTPTREVTVSSAGVFGDGEPDGCSSNLTCSTSIVITPDGRYVAYNTSFTNLVPGDTNDQQDVFVHDLETGTTERISIGDDESQANGPSAEASISADGRFVSFRSQATNLVPGVTVGEHVYLRDRVAGTTEVISISPTGTIEEGSSAGGELSADGRIVAFWSDAFRDDTTNDPRLPFGGINFGNVYVRDRVAGTTELVSLTETGGRSMSVETYRSEVSISADGRYVAFEARRHDLTAGDSNGNVDIFVRDRLLERTERITVDDDGEGANWASYSPSLSADGRFVAFMSFASNLVPADANGSTTSFFGGGGGGDIFVRDRVLGTTERVSVSSTGAEADQGSDFPSISPDGRYVVFTSTARTLAPGTSDYLRRVFRHDRVSRETVMISVPGPTGPFGTAFVGAPSASHDGARIAFAGASTNSPFDDAAFVGSYGGTIDVTEAVSDVGTAGGTVSGTVALGGGVASAASDVVGDADAASLGGDLAAARVIARPEAEDTLIEITPTDLPTVSTALPGSNYALDGVTVTGAVSYEVSFTSNAQRYRITASADPATGFAPRFTLQRCPVCSEIATLAGSWGSVGTAITISIPSSVADLAALSEIEVRATAPGSSDLLELPDASLEAPRVEVGFSTAGNKTYPIAATVSEGRFAAAIATAQVPSGAEQVWARACHLGVCQERFVAPLT